MKRFEWKDNRFYIDGKQTLLRSGAIHYFRVPKAYWLDRLLKLKECGFNCVETYIPWNLHEPREGEFHFEENVNFIEFLKIAQTLGLYAIVRPGPYICAEWEGGGFPAWLLEYEGMKIRTNTPLFMEKAKRYLQTLIPLIRPQLLENGGNVLMVQVENEYGSFGEDKVYLNEYCKIYREGMPECTLFTCDGGDYLSTLRRGAIEGVLQTSTFGSDVEKNMKNLEELRPRQPHMCMEFWCGWFDHWGDGHHTRPTQEKRECIRAFLQNGYSFNVYMFHGGTNFGFMNGANLLNDDTYWPTVTSYDYDAPLSESGDRTPAYYAIREEIGKYFDLPPLTATDGEKAAYGRVIFDEYADLFDNLERIGRVYYADRPLMMEECKQAYGYIYYQTEITETQVLDLVVRDRAIVYVDGEKKATFLRQGGDLPRIEVQRGKLGIFVENMGRINYDKRMFDKKGLSLTTESRTEWKSISLPMENLQNLQFLPLPTEEKELPAFYKAKFKIEKAKDTFLKLTGFKKGFAMINGINLGRYFNESLPTKTLYVPAPFLKDGENELIVFDSEGGVDGMAEFIDKAEL